MGWQVHSQLSRLQAGRGATKLQLETALQAGRGATKLQLETALSSRWVGVMGGWVHGGWLSR